ncbi:MAG TPA: hypothetical protein VH598_13460, partial [Verrucomicrobiae bacterium]|nr:hypothetical protein [Verrucomicrobiae bacterium]
AQAPLRQFKGDRPANNAAANDQDIVRFHTNILSAMGIDGGFCRIGFETLLQIDSFRCPHLESEASAPLSAVKLN